MLEMHELGHPLCRSTLSRNWTRRTRGLSRRTRSSSRTTPAWCVADQPALAGHAARHHAPLMQPCKLRLQPVEPAVE